MKHRCVVMAKAEGDHVTLTVQCDTCEGGTFTIHMAHMETLARVLPNLCDTVGIDIAAGTTTEPHVLELPDDTSAADVEAAGQALLAEFVQQRTKDDTKH